MARKFPPGRAVAALTAIALLCPTQSALADFTRLGNTLIGSAIGAALQGSSVALSGNGNTAIIGGPFDNSELGAAWVFTRVPGGNWAQQGAKLVGGNSVGGAQQGSSVALSADGNTAIVGGRADNGSVGAAWIFTRSGGTWSQQGPKLVGSNNVGAAQQGFSVALSADGNTALIGGRNDNNNDGATWVFTRSGGVWSEQVKLIGTGAAGHAQQGSSVALSGDGNTAIIGGSFDNANAGAVWVFTRGGGGWTQQGAKLVGTGAMSAAFQGVAVALSGDGNTAIVGGPGDNSNAGAAWVFTRSGAVWAQQGAKLTGNGAVGQPNQGNAVALSLDGNTAIVGGPTDNGAGAAWAFTRSGGTWSPLGAKLVAVGHNDVAFSVALSGDGKTALLGAPGDNSNVGGAFPFVQPGAKLNPAATHDFDNNGVSDILFENTGGGIALWLMNSNAAIGSAIGVGAIDPSVWTIVGQRDLNGDGTADILLRATDGSIGEWLMNANGTIKSANGLGTLPVGVWSIVGTGDFNNDGIGDILWYHSSGAVAVWLMNSNGALLSALGVGSLPLQWSIAGTGDFDGDAISDILWYHTSGAVAVWLMNTNGTIKSANGLGTLPVGTWSIAGTGDFNGDGISDILLSVTGNGVGIWFMNASGQVASAQGVGTMTSGWTIAQTGDFNSDGKSDVLWYHAASGSIGAWLLSSASIVSAVGIGSLPPATWTIANANSE